MDTKLQENFAYWRSRGKRATVALASARAELAEGKRRYGACSPKIAYNPFDSAYGFKLCAWIENAADGLRLVGFADEIAKSEGRSRAIDHTGWYTEDEGMNGETLRGVVYQLPARNGAPLFVFGYADPNNKGAAYLSFDFERDKMHAARSADQLAERAAEMERDYNRAWQAGARFADLGAEVKAERKRILDLCAEVKAIRRSVIADVPTVCATLRDSVRKAWDTIQEARAERARLADAYGNEAAFKEHLPQAAA